jgi:hypothetical protein
MERGAVEVVFGFPEAALERAEEADFDFAEAPAFERPEVAGLAFAAAPVLFDLAEAVFLEEAEPAFFEDALALFFAAAEPAFFDEAPARFFAAVELAFFGPAFAELARALDRAEEVDDDARRVDPDASEPSARAGPDVPAPPRALPSRLLERLTGRERGRLEKTSPLESSAIG